MQQKISQNNSDIKDQSTRTIIKQKVPQNYHIQQPILAVKKQKPKIFFQITKNTSIKVPRANTKNIMFVILLLIIIPGYIIYNYSDWVPSAVHHAQQFDFQVFCPVYYDIHNLVRKQRDQSFTGYIMQHIYPLADKLSIYSKLYGQQQKKLYVVNILDCYNQTNSTNYGIRYCGLARPRSGTCEKDSKLICTNPGPTFETIKDQQIIVIWVNKIGNLQQKYLQYVSKNLSSCYQIYRNEQDRPQFCTLMSKLPQFKHLVYQDPTIPPPTTHYRNFTINNMTTPISTYVHGMVVRPTFNGGPLSWFTSKGQVGIGFSTAQIQNYDLMRSVMTRRLKLNQILKKRYNIDQLNYKIDIYQNRQQPAALLYYDSAMSVAKKNLMSGLSGFYIIRNEQIQKYLPSQQFEHHIIIHPSAAAQNNFKSAWGKTQSKTKPIALASSDYNMIFRNNLYRFRLANADFTKFYHKIRFMANTQQNSDEIPLQFWVIGTDSSLLNKPIGPITELDTIAPAERFDLLINFGIQLDKIVKIVHGDNYQIITTLYLQQKPMKEIREINIPSVIPGTSNLNFTNYQNRVVRRRMRPFSKTSDKHIATNGHLTIFEGQSQDPYLGSFQDWYFINNLNTPQAIHIDLIQFQAIDLYSLKQFPNTKQCTFYDVDFFMRYAQNCHSPMKIGNKTLKPQQFKNFVGQTLEDYLDMCKYMKKLNKTQYTDCFCAFKNQKSNQGPRHLSGIDVQQICSSNDKSVACNYRQKRQNMKQQTNYKYKDRQIKIYQYRKGFKDVQIIPQLAYTRIRIRWTKSDFPVEQTKQSERRRQLYFLASEEQLSQYPGYTYRSTLVIGEQSNMIRPIMMQPNPKGRSKTWKQIFKKLDIRQLSENAKMYTSWHEDDDI